MQLEQDEPANMGLSSNPLTYWLWDVELTTQLCNTLLPLLKTQVGGKAPHLLVKGSPKTKPGAPPQPHNALKRRFLSVRVHTTPQTN